jgi:hypothetical protein
MIRTPERAKPMLRLLIVEDDLIRARTFRSWLPPDVRAGSLAVLAVPSAFCDSIPAGCMWGLSSTMHNACGLSPNAHRVVTRPMSRWTLLIGHHVRSKHRCSRRPEVLRRPMRTCATDVCWHEACTGVRRGT